ncbi:winged helix-turn-helix transcriptional regulator [Rhodococcus artemisiae]|uniref:Helix-turn-helix domain-containing protein n=1 Tax=Rhodococcus artemisiae TaxID=714159 RepID=A0ABU7L745_9NOCA|nr:helix-turn-helix domain-containing protein [Rhodococcus artemisiae]MEE2057362.1 helix-turn-helix domain-containing protein [Rhodococcus artemisiae]
MDPSVSDARLVDCPARLAVEIIADKWSVLVIFALSERPRRHGELIAMIGGVSRKVLTQTLRKLQGYGLVYRAETTSQVEYRLSELGSTLIDPIEMLNRWGREYSESVADFQEGRTTSM